MPITTELRDAYRYWRQEPQHSAMLAMQSPARHGRGRSAVLALRQARSDVQRGMRRYPAGRVYRLGPVIGAYRPRLSSSLISFRPASAGPAGWGNAASDGAVWVESLDAAGLRFVDWADEIVSLRHTGWRTDSDDLEPSLRGAVLQLSSRDGRPCYLAAYADPHNDGAYRIELGRGALYYGEVRGLCFALGPDSGARDAARAADSFAQRSAEHEREYHEAWSAGAIWADLGAPTSRPYAQRLPSASNN